MASFDFAIPGYTWDPIRKKYFPSAAPPVVTSFNHSASSRQPQPYAGSSRSAKRSREEGPIPPPSRKGKERQRSSRLPIQILNERGRGNSRSSRTDLSQTMLVTSRSERTSYVPMASSSSFMTTAAYGNGNLVVGDSAGTIYSLRTGSGSWQGWHEQMNLMNSPITSVNVQNDSFIATSFGPAPKLLVSPLDSTTTSNPMVIVAPKKAIDVWTSLYLPNGGVALGCDAHFLYTPSPLHTTSMSVHSTGNTSVLSLAVLSPEDPSVILAGTRSGFIKLYDTRKSWKNSTGGDDIVKSGSPVVGMKGVGGKAIVAAGMNGSLDIYDLRFLSSRSTAAMLPPTSFSSKKFPQQHQKAVSSRSPITLMTEPSVSLPGHHNSFTVGLALLHHAQSNTVLAAGQDCKVRCWDARDGRLMSGDMWPLAPGASRKCSVRGLVEMEHGLVGVGEGQNWDFFGSNTIYG